MAIRYGLIRKVAATLRQHHFGAVIFLQIWFRLEIACRNTNDIAHHHAHNELPKLVGGVCIRWIRIWPWNERSANHRISMMEFAYLCNYDLPATIFSIWSDERARERARGKMPCMEVQFAQGQSLNLCVSIGWTELMKIGNCFVGQMAISMHLSFWLQSNFEAKLTTISRGTNVQWLLCDKPYLFLCLVFQLFNELLSDCVLFNNSTNYLRLLSFTLKLVYWFDFESQISIALLNGNKKNLFVFTIKRCHFAKPKWNVGFQ